MIGGLAALMLPAFAGVKQRGLAVQSTQNLKSLVAANVAYAADQGCYAPADDKWNNRRWHGARTSAGGVFDPTKGFLAGYLGKNAAVMKCPLFAKMVVGGKSFENGSGGYGYNASYIGGTPTWGYNGDGTRVSARPAQVARPSRTVMFGTTAYAVEGGVEEYPFVEPPFWDFGSGPSGVRPSASLHFRFQGKALVGWCDGHVSQEEKGGKREGENPHGGNAEEENLGWFGPDEGNGYWNPNWEG